MNKLISRYMNKIISRYTNKAINASKFTLMINANNTKDSIILVSVIEIAAKIIKIYNTIIISILIMKIIIIIIMIIMMSNKMRLMIRCK